MRDKRKPLEPVRTGVLGCGAVSHQYLPVIRRLSNLEVVAVADTVPERAEEVCAEFGIPESTSPDELIESSRVELVVNLTPIPNHFETTAAALDAGKHVYSEKSLAMTSEDARKLLELSVERKLVLGCAPDTLLGCGFSAARHAIERGDIGTPLVASGLMLRAPLTAFPGVADGTLPLYDMAPYYLTAMVDLFGPAQRVVAFYDDRSTASSGTGGGRDVVAASASVEFSTLVAQLSFVWGTSQRQELPFVSVFGTDGEVRLSNPNAFDGPAILRRYSEGECRELPDSKQEATLPANLRGLGVADAARAIRDRRPPRASAEVAAHVVDLIDCIVLSARSGRRVEVTTRCAPPAALSDGERSELLDGLLVTSGGEGQ
jgi:predicted dehydrogenase